ncbi:MAG: hypothetical protein ACRETD_00495 [Steroidobacteraceae bacterium]
MYKLRLLMFTGLLSVLTAVAATTTAHAAKAAPAGRPAVWTTHDIIVGFERLPKTYSCDALWYKFRDVLRAIGAAPDLRILAYQCGSGLGSLALSPQVHLHFSIPQAVGAAQARWADLDAAPRTVRLAPGHPASLDASDCQLLRQMKDGLLAVLPDRVISFNLACAVPATDGPYSVSIEALMPVAAQARVASRANPAPAAPID